GIATTWSLRARTYASRGSAVAALQKMQPPAFGAPMYAIRHGAHRARCAMARSRAAAPPGSALGRGLGGALGVAVDPQPQFLADLEERHPLGRHRDALAGARIAPVARLAVLDDEAAETADLDP